jgi:predicted amidophosphoribosyltransferase
MKVHKCLRCKKEIRSLRKLCDRCFVQDNIDRFGYL